MLKKIVLALFACAAVGFSRPALANQSPQQAYCTPVYTVVSHGAVASAPLNQEFAFDLTCPGNPGDWFSDGPLYVNQPTFSGSSYNFNIPQMVWYVIGQRVYTPSVAETVGASTTTYYWLDNTTSQWTATLTNSAPDTTSTLGYTVASNGSGITSILPATAASIALNAATSSSLQVSGGIAADAAIVPPNGFGCGTGSTACDFQSHTSSSGSTAFFFNNPVCTGSNNDIMQFSNTSTLKSYVGCDGSYSIGSAITLSPSGGLYLNNPSLGLPIETTNGPVIAAAPGTAPSLITAGELYTSTSGTAGAIQFGQVGAGDDDCTLDFSVATLQSGCNLSTTNSFIVGNSTLTPCDICDGTSGSPTNSVLAYGAGAALGYNTIGSTNSTLTFGSTVIPGNGLAITNSVAGLIDVFDADGTLGINGDFRAGHSVGSLRSVIGGFATAVAPISANYGDVEGSRSTSTGNLNLGGTSSSCNLDYGVTTASVLTAGCALTTGTHNTCSATSGWPCSFTWSATLSSGAGTATQAVPTSSFCTVTPTITLKISSTNVDVYWVTISSTTLTVHVSDMLGTDSRSITGNGSCSP